MLFSDSFSIFDLAAFAVTYVLCPASVLLLMYWAYGSPRGTKPDGGYDHEPRGRGDERLGCVDRNSREHLMRREQFRIMLSRSNNDDEVADAIDWAYYVLRLSDDEINGLLDAVRPLNDPHDQAALAVRRMYLTRNCA